MTDRVVVVGVGGIGTHLLTPLCRYLSYCGKEVSLALVDGDAFEPKNADRQSFAIFGNKAEVTSETLKQNFPSLLIEAKPLFVSDENVFLLIREGDTVLLCVDNHATRNLVSRHCASLENVRLISGGNEYTDGNVQVYIRQDGKDVTPPLTHLHPEIADPADKNPAEMSCEELSKNGAPQLIITNVLAAVLMLAAFWRIGKDPAITYTEQYFDLMTGMVRAVQR
jgi:molybdopterin/thiamine biosynthesis adenylyltransferase